MQDFSHSIADVSQHFLKQSKQAVLATLQDSVHFEEFCSVLCAAEHSAFLAVLTKRAKGGGAAAPVLLDCAASLTALLNDINNGADEIVACVALLSNPTVRRTAGADDAEGVDADDNASEASDAGAGPEDALQLCNVTFRTLNAAQPLEALLLELSEVHDPLCRGSSNNALVASHIAELMSSIKSQNNFREPFKLERFFHSEVVAVCAANPAANKDQLFDLLGPRNTANDFVNEVQTLRSQCYQKLDINTFPTYPRSVRDELAYCQNLERWIENVKQQFGTREWDLTTKVLARRHDRKPVDKLTPAQTIAAEYLRFLSTIPYTTILSAPSEAELPALVRKVFERLHDCTTTTYPPARCVHLGDAVVTDTCLRVVEFGRKKKDLFVVPSDEARAWLDGVKDALNEAQQGMAKFDDVRGHRSSLTYRGHHGKDERKIPENAALVSLQERIAFLLKFFDTHSVLSVAVTKLFAHSDNSSYVEDLDAAFGEMGAAMPVLWDFSEANVNRFKACNNAYTAIVSAVDSSMAALVKTQLSNASCATEMFRIHDKYQPVIHREKVQLAANQFRAHMLQLTDSDIKAARERYGDKLAAREASHVAMSRGVSSTVARILWDKTTERRLEELLHKRDNVTEFGWWRLFALQNSDHHWALNDALSHFTGVPLATLEKLVAPNRKVPLDVYGTAVALAFLEYVHGEDKASWAARAAPALKYVEGVEAGLQLQGSTSIVTAARSKLRETGVGQRHEFNQQQTFEQHGFRKAVTEKMEKDVLTWCKAALAKIHATEMYAADKRTNQRRLQGAIMTVKTAADKSLTLAVQFPLDVGTLIKDERELRALGLLGKKGQHREGVRFQIAEATDEIRDFIFLVEQLHPLASNLAALLDAYYSTTKTCAADVSLLLEKEHNAIQAKFADGARLDWNESADMLRGYVRSLSKLLQAFCAGVRDMVGTTRKLRESVATMGQAATSQQGLRTWMERTSKMVDDLAVLSPANVGIWVRHHLQPEVDAVLTKHLSAIVTTWTKEFRLLDPVARDIAESMETERRSMALSDGADGDAFARLFGFQNMRVSIRVHQQQVRLDPPLVACRRQWVARLNEAVAWVCELPPLECTQVGDGNAHSFQRLVARLPEGQLLGAFNVVEAALAAAQEQVEQWRRHQVLWEMDLASLVGHLGNDLGKWTQIVTEVRHSAKRMMDAMQTTIVKAGLEIDCGEVQRNVSVKYEQMSNVLVAKFREVLGVEIEKLYKVLCAERDVLEAANVGHSMDDALELLCTAAETTANLDAWGDRVRCFVEGQALLFDRRMLDAPAGWIDAERVQSEYAMLSELFQRKMAEVEARRAHLHTQVEANVKLLMAKVDRADDEFRASDLEHGSAAVPLALMEVTKYSDGALRLEAEALKAQRAQAALGIEGLKMRRLTAMCSDLAGLKSVYDALNAVHNEVEEMGARRFVEVVPRREQATLKEIEANMNNLPGNIRNYQPYQLMLVRVRKLVSMGAVVAKLRSEALRERHWVALQHDLRMPPSWRLSELTLGSIWEADPIANDKPFKNVIRVAEGELALETFVGGIKKYWEDYLLDITNYHNKVNLVRGWDVLFEKLGEHLGSLQSMKLSPFYREFEATANDWDEKLNRVRQVLDVLVDVQRRWVYLEGIFGSSADIRQQLPVESSLFEKTSRELFAVMPRPKKDVALTVLRYCGADKLLATTERISRELTSIQRALGDYLETQRASFPRFYFVGDEDLLEVIGNGKDPRLVAKHLRKMFSGIAQLQVTDDNRIDAIVSAETEQVALSPAVESTDVKVNDWLMGLHESMVGTLRAQVHRAAASIPADAAQLPAWIDQYPNQVVCLAMQIAWTAHVEQTMASGASATAVEKRMSQALEHLAATVLDPTISVILRTKIEQIICVCVYQRDVARALAARKATAADFQWLSCLRCYLASDSENKGGVACRIADAEVQYSFEYLGVAERLVQTPLTDKCYLTLTQALHAHLGGAPSGPAGTGKTETVKALGAQLARFVLVFCCDEAFDFKAMGRIFVGLCQVGAWGCFDEFNRLEERILSAVSQQIQAIQEGLKARAAQIEIVDRRVPLNKEVGIFITMNPGYAGRSKLPDNLTQLFRPVAMTAPDRENIAEVLLFAQGFKTAEVLSKKIVPLFRLCKDQLSQQSHYDFGLRAMKSVLVSAGALKRAATAAGRADLTADDEVQLMLQSLTETMVPKLVAADAGLFYPLLKDVFPGHELRDVSMDALLAAVQAHAAEKSYVVTDAWMAKIAQLYKILQVNHGVMLVGASGSGKSTAWSTLLAALAAVEDVDGHAYIIDPKALSKADLYGVLDPTTREWRDGVFTATLRTLVDNVKGDDQSKKRHWILFDGDVDPEWVENLNALLDDNRLLTLPNGERLALPPNVRILFEVQDLRYATLATVSRCGMVWFGDDTMPTGSYIQHYYDALLRRPCSARDADAVDVFAGRGSAVEAQRRKSGETNDFTPEQQSLLDLQRVCLADIGTEFGAGGLVERCVGIAKDRIGDKGVMEWCTLQAVRSVFALLTSAIEDMLLHAERHGALDADTLARYMKRRLSFSLCWGLASGCSIEAREEFAEQLKLPDGPKSGSIFDHEVRMEDGQWVEWKARVPVTDIPAAKVGTNDVVIPTVDTTRHEEVIASWLKTGRPVVLCGPPGSGKTMSLTAVLRSSTEYDCAFLNFSSGTRPDTVIKLLEEYGTYKNTMNGMVLTPISGKKLIVFCDEINLPSTDKYGTQQVVQLMRQMTERNGFYRAKDNAWITLEHIQFAGACNPPTDPGRTPMTLRFLGWAPVLFVDFPSYDSLLQIYSTYCRALFLKNPRLRAAAGSLCRAMVDFYKASQKRFTADMQRHYVYSPRELSRWSRAIHEGIASLEEAQQMTLTVDEVVRLAAHEGLRLFRDRLCAPEEEQWTDRKMDECFAAAFPNLDPSALQRPILYSTVLTRAYASVEVEELRKHVQGRLHMFADEELDVQLVVFDSMLDHVTRIDRVLRQPLGHMLLIGSAGVGKTVLSKFVAWLNNMAVFQIKAHRGYTIQDFEEDLRTVMRRAGCKREKIVFLFDESNIMDSGFLEYMNALLASGEVPGLFEGEEWSTLMHQVRDGLAQPGSGHEHVDQTSEQDMYKWFIAQVTTHLHVIFTMNPHSPDFHNRTATSPALFNRCTIDWFGDWSPSTMVRVALELTSKVDVLDANPGRFPDAQSAQENLAGCMHSMHERVARVNMALRDKSGNRGTFITPRHFLDFIQHFHALFKEKRNATHDLQRHLNGGLSKLHETAAKVDEQQLALNEKNVVLKATGGAAQEMLTKIVAETTSAKNAKEAAETLAVQLEAESRDIVTQQTSAEAQLSEAQPALDEAAAALNTIKPEYLREIRAYTTPPPMVKKVLEAVCMVLGEKKINDWDVIKAVTRKDDFLSLVRGFKPSSLSDELRNKIKKIYMSQPDFTYEAAQRASKCAGPLVKWILANVKFAEIHLSIAPLRASIDALMTERSVKQAGLDAAEKTVHDNEAAIARLQEEYHEMMTKNSAIKAEIGVVAARCQRAQALMMNLTSERTRWDEQAQNFRSQMTCVLGDSLISAAFLAYIGYFDEQVRTNDIIPEWRDVVDAQRIDYRRDMALTEYLSRPEQRMAWSAAKLPQDDLCVENAIILARFQRYPLVIDPSGQAVDFLMESMKDKKIVKTSFLDKSFMKQLEMCVRFGSPILIQDVENIDPVLNPLLNKEIHRSGSRSLVRLGAQEIDINAAFTMYLTTRDSTFQFTPDLCGRVSMVNFTVTPSSLRSQVLHALLLHERQDIEEKRSDLLKLQGEYVLRLRMLEDELLTAISDSEGHILENEALINTLEVLKTESADIQQKMANSDAAFRDITDVEAKYTPVAAAASQLYFSFGELDQLCPTYRFSLHFFFALVDDAMADLPNVAPDARLAVVRRNLFGLANVRITRSMFQRDHLAFQLRLAQHRCNMDADAPGVDGAMWRCLLQGGATDDDAVPAVVPASTPQTTRAALAAVLRLPAFAAAKASMAADGVAQWEAFFAADRPKEALPAAPFAQLGGVARAFAAMLLLKVLRPEAFAIAAEDFLETLFDRDAAGAVREHLAVPFHSKAHLYDVRACLPELAPFTPLLLVCSPGYDASNQIEALAAAENVQLHVVAMGSPEGYEQANRSVAAAMQTGAWALLKNVHLSGTFLVSLEKRLHAERMDGKVNKAFRLFLASEASDKIPQNLISASRVLTFEPPPGIKSNMLRTFGTLKASALPAYPRELPRICFVASWLHAVVVERMRYVPLGWSKRYEFSETDYFRVVDAVVAWVSLVAGDRHNVGPQDLPWVALRHLVAQTIYGGKIDNAFDMVLLENFTDKFLAPAIFDGAFSLAPSAERVNCDGSTVDDFKAWIAQLPESEPPQWLGLPSSATTMVLVHEARETVQRVAKIQGSALGADDSSPTRAAAAALRGAAPVATKAAWIVRLQPLLERWQATVEAAEDVAFDFPAAIASDPLPLALAREIATGAALRRRIAGDLAGLLAVCGGKAKPTNVQRTLIEDMSREAVPARWRAYAGATGITLSLWLKDFARRLAALKQLTQAGPAESVGGRPVPLGSLFFPEAFITATRQLVSRHTKTSLELLVLRTTVSTDVGKAALLAAADPCSFVVSGAVLRSAAVSAAGVLQQPAAELLAALETPVLVTLSWAAADEAPAPMAGTALISFPLYLDDSRRAVLAESPLAVDAAVEQSTWFLKGVCITAWQLE
jgi:dynein heavy chain 1